MAEKAIKPHLQKVLQQYLNTVKNADKTDLEKPFNTDTTADFVHAIENCIGSSLLLGRLHAEEERTKAINAADEEIPPIKFEEAIDFLKAKVPLTKEQWLDLEPKLRFRAFTVAKLGEAKAINTAKEILTKALEDGTGYAETWEDLKKVVNTDVREITPGYWENVFRTNTQSAYIAGKLQQYEDFNDIKAYQLFVIEDSRTSRYCRNLLTSYGRGFILPIDHKFWKENGFPPYHFQCRTSIRAVFGRQIGRQGINVDNPTRKELDGFKPMTGFGGNPISKGSFWLMSEDMKQQALEYGLVPDIVKMAHNLGLSNYDFELAGNFAKPQILQGTKYKVKALKGARPKQKEILTSRILEENGHQVVMLPEVGIKNISNPDALIDYDIVADYKVPDGSSLNGIENAVVDANKQQVTHVVIYPRTHNYTKQEAIMQIKRSFKKVDKLKEAWLIWDDQRITVLKR